MKLSEENQRKVEKNLGLVHKVINDRSTGLTSWASIPGRICSRLDASGFVKPQQPIKAETSRLMPTD